MESQMTREEIKTVIKQLEDQLAIQRREHKELVEIYENQKRIVSDLCMTSIVTIVLHLTLVQWMRGQDSLSLQAIGTYIQPINFIVFMIAAVFAIARGYEFFTNTEHKLACKLNKKLKRSSLSYEIRVLSDNIRLLEKEFDRLHGELGALASAENIDEKLEDEEENSRELWKKDIMKEETF